MTPTFQEHSHEQTILVQIFGREYKLRSRDSEQYVLKLARMIDDRMKAVEHSTKTVDSVRVAVLSALNLADDYCKLREEYSQRVLELEEEQSRLLELVNSALKEEVTLPDA